MRASVHCAGPPSLRPLCSLDNAEDFPNAEDFLEIAREKHFGVLARAALVCRQWRCLAEDPLLWRDFVLCLDSSSNLDLLPGMDRFSAVRSLVVRTVSEEKLFLLGQQLGARPEGGKLDTLVFLNQGFRRLPSFRGIVQAVPLLKNFMVRGSDFSDFSNLSEALFAELAGAMDEGRSRLQSISLGGCPSLHSIPPVQLVRVVAGLRKADIGYTYLKESQVAALMAVLLEGSKLEELDIRGSDFLQVEPKTLARVVHGIKKIFLDVSVSQKPQLEEVLKMCTGATKLQQLYIYVFGRALENVDRDLIDEARKKVEIDLGGMYLEEELSSSEDEDNENDEELMVVEENEDLEVPDQYYEEVVDHEDEELEVKEQEDEELSMNSKQDEELEVDIKEDE